MTGAQSKASQIPVPIPSTAINDHHEHNATGEPHYLTSLQQRQQQAAEYYRSQPNPSRPSSSSGSQAHTLRRTPNFERLSPHPRPSSVNSSAQIHPPRVRFASPSRFLPTRLQSRAPELCAPHPALRISRRTASAIRFVLEEALRHPYPFTPDLAEENATMSEMTGAGGVRAANGGARTTSGPVPVTRADHPNIRTPIMVLHERRQREARRQQNETEARAAEEQRKAEEERRKSAERRAQAAGVAGAPLTNTPQRHAAQSAPLRTGDGQHAQTSTTGGGVARQPERLIPSAGGPVNPPASSQAQDASAGAQYGRPRAGSHAQQPQSRTAPTYEGTQASANDQRRPPPMQHSRRPSAQTGATQAGATAAPAVGATTPNQTRQSNASSFPHAFERWETLSSHWEGLTSYWIRRLEQNTDEAGRDQPLVQQMSRQITDLSAAGANLFHAVVELQRLRASSERKFQRWFYEHRQEQEKAQEREAQFDQILRAERDARSEAVENMERMAMEKKNAERMVVEMKRELQISKEEARRAWEELGRREQEERDRTFSLAQGQPVSIGGVQVVPAQVTQRGHGSEETYPAGQGSGQGIEQRYTYDEGESPTDTDPFVEQAATPRRQPATSAPLTSGTYVPSGASAPASSARPTVVSQAQDQAHIPAPLNPQQRVANQPNMPSTSSPEAFYQQPEAYLHRDTVTTIGEDERSYVTSPGGETSEGDEEYAVDQYGNFILDDAGHRVPYRSLRQHDSDEFDVQEDRRRELEHLQRYGSGPQSGSSYVATTSAGQGGFTSPNLPDYSGAGYGSEWTSMRHHHPTRLSDVLEEDERSTTAPSRASQASRGRY
ncbi:hypothetical protein M011DRAFT_494269 [Sporormia fimetaria CBS 119925]|uniref:Uncharacterized protein n=1 Tax=Sporormia fimetaria CBS 119925 TaxID=1340428 RepID=A0A6A6VEA9_9PLEO|nr:hypothetical protein M011DRAFT_494269 [Sporormia fimetaria CBS 119925]